MFTEIMYVQMYKYHAINNALFTDAMFTDWLFRTRVISNCAVFTKSTSVIIIIILIIAVATFMLKRPFVHQSDSKQQAEALTKCESGYITSQHTQKTHWKTAYDHVA